MLMKYHKCTTLTDVKTRLRGVKKHYFIIAERVKFEHRLTFYFISYLQKWSIFA